MAAYGPATLVEGCKKPFDRSLAAHHRLPPLIEGEPLGQRLIGDRLQPQSSEKKGYQMPSAEEYISAGINGIDQVLGGGLLPGQLYLIRGGSGAGKTTLGLQFLMEGARKGEKVLYIGTSETEQELRRIALSHGWALDGVSLHHIGRPKVGEDQTMLHPAEVELPEVMDSILSVADDLGPARLVIDSLAEIRTLARDEQWYRRQLLILKSHFADKHCAVLLTEIAGEDRSTKLNSVASGVIELEQIPLPYGPDRRRLRVVKMRGQDFLTGYHDYRIYTGGIEVFPRLIAAEHRQRIALEKVDTGLAELDLMLKGGIIRGTSTLLLGPSGTGKSIIATQIAVAAAERGERSAIYVFDERVQTVFHRAEEIGLPLAQHVEQGTIEVRQVDAGEMTCGQFSHIVRKSVEDHEVRMLVLDSLNGYAFAMPEERFLGLHLHELSSYLTQQKVNAIFTMTQHGLMSERVDQPFDVSYIADTVILFRHFEHAGRLRKAISVYKNRAGAHETTIRELEIGPEGLFLSQPLSQFEGIFGLTPLLKRDTQHGNHSDAESADS